MTHGSKLLFTSAGPCTLKLNTFLYFTSYTPINSCCSLHRIHRMMSCYDMKVFLWFWHLVGPFLCALHSFIYCMLLHLACVHILLYSSCWIVLRKLNLVAVYTFKTKKQRQCICIVTVFLHNYLYGVS